MNMKMVCLIVSLFSLASHSWGNLHFRSQKVLHQNFKPSSKKLVCTISLGSKRQKNLLEKNLPSKDFDFEELSSEGSKWFDQKCAEFTQSNKKCDLLVITGHFAGREFFSDDSSRTLPIPLVENHSCGGTCQGILNDPKEVFLFGCNTMSDGSVDHARWTEKAKKKYGSSFDVKKLTSDQAKELYTELLTDHGYKQDDAEEMAEYRYLDGNSSTQTKMSRIFKGTGKIYGFASVFAGGEASKEEFGAYLKEKGPKYSSYLDTLDAKKINQSLKNKFNQFGIIECEPCIAGDPACAEREKICKFITPEHPNYFEKKNKQMLELLSSSESLKYYPYILSVFDEMGTLNSEEKAKILKNITPQMKKDYFSNLAKLKNANALKFEWKRMGMRLGFETEETVRQDFSQFLESELRLKPIKTNLLRTICDLRLYNFQRAIYPVSTPHQQLLLSKISSADKVNFQDCISELEY